VPRTNSAIDPEVCRAFVMAWGQLVAQ
jgi:hypothetical protein